MNQPRSAARPLLSLLIVSITMALAACHSPRDRCCCCCAQDLRSERQDRRGEPRQEMDRWEQPMQQGHDPRDQRRNQPGYDRGGNWQPNNPPGDRGGDDQARREHEQEDRIHLELHQRLDRLTEHLAEVERRLEQLTRDQRRAPGTTR